MYVDACDNYLETELKNRVSVCEQRQFDAPWSGGQARQGRERQPSAAMPNIWMTLYLNCFTRLSIFCFNISCSRGMSFDASQSAIWGLFHDLVGSLSFLTEWYDALSSTITQLGWRWGRTLLNHSWKASPVISSHGILLLNGIRIPKDRYILSPSCCRCVQ